MRARPPGRDDVVCRLLVTIRSVRWRHVMLAGALVVAPAACAGSDDGVGVGATETAATPETTASPPVPPEGATDDDRDATTLIRPDERDWSIAEVAPVCAAYEQLADASSVSSVAGAGDPKTVDLLLLAAMPALAPVWEEAAAAFPIDGVSNELAEVTRAATEQVVRAAAAVETSDVDRARLDRIGRAVVAGPDAVGVLPDDDIDTLLDADLVAQLAAVEFDLATAFDDVGDPDLGELAALCPEIADLLGVGPVAVVGDACDLVDAVTLQIVFWPESPEPDPDDAGTGMCVWASGDRELVVSLTDAAIVEQTRAGNAEALDVVPLPDLGDEAWVIEGLLVGVSASSGRGGFGSGRATVGVVLGDTGLLVAVRSDGGDAGVLAESVAAEITPRLVGLD